jgi:hypothetical protein
MRPYPVRDAISSNTYKLKASPVTTMPRSPEFLVNALFARDEIEQRNHGHNHQDKSIKVVHVICDTKRRWPTSQTVDDHPFIQDPHQQTNR